MLLTHTTSVAAVQPVKQFLEKHQSVRKVLLLGECYLSEYTTFFVDSACSL